MSVILSNEIYNELHKDLKIFSFPIDIFNNDLIHKIYSFNFESENTINEEKEEFALEFNINETRMRKEEIFNVIKLNFDLLIENLFSSYNINKQNYNLIIKSMINLAFHNLVQKNYTIVLNILNDLIYEFDSQDFYDEIFYMKIRDLQEKVIYKVNQNEDL